MTHTSLKILFKFTNHSLIVLGIKYFVRVKPSSLQCFNYALYPVIHA